jgi:5'-3' exonuclease
VKLYLGCSSFWTWTYKYHHIPQMFYKDRKYF